MRNILFILLFIFSSTALYALDGAKRERTIKVIGKKENIVSAPHISLADIAQVFSPTVDDDEAIIALKRIKLSESPAPGKSMTLPANTILDKMKEHGVQLGELGYSLPRVITITRAARKITEAEVETAIKAALGELDGRSLEFLKMHYRSVIQVAPGALKLRAQISPARRVGNYRANLIVESLNEKPITFSVPFEVKEWADVPVASRALPKGSIISESDIVMARADLSELPADVARNSEQIVGQETKRNIGYGESFATKKLVIPPVVEKGGMVKLLYKTRLLEATASGIALESGVVGEKIRIRNENSRRTVIGTIVESGLVRVNP